MTLSPKICALSTCGALLATVFSMPAQAADDAHLSFDGNIRNNSLALSPDEATAVVSYSERPDVVVYNLQTGAMRGALRGYVTPRNIVFAPDGKVFYVSDSSLGTVAKIDTASLQAQAPIAAGPGAFGTALSKDGSTLYVNNQASSTVTRFDTATGQARAVITGFAQPRQGVRLSPDGTVLYVTNFLGDKISIVDTASNKITGEIAGFKQPRQAIAFTRDGKTAYVLNVDLSVAKVDRTTQQIVSTMSAFGG